MTKIMRRMYASARNAAPPNNMIAKSGPARAGAISTRCGVDVSCAGASTDRPAAQLTGNAAGTRMAPNRPANEVRHWTDQSECNSIM